MQGFNKCESSSLQRITTALGSQVMLMVGHGFPIGMVPGPAEYVVTLLLTNGVGPVIFKVCPATVSRYTSVSIQAFQVPPPAKACTIAGIIIEPPLGPMVTKPLLNCGVAVAGQSELLQ